jgi:MoaA/NifB/PqqE/SkfB family radical SAM enzyme
MFNLESFCGELWSQLEINTLGDYKICCLANYGKDYGMARDKNGNVMNVMTHTIEEAINSETHKDHRLQLKENIQVKRCRNCYVAEHSTKNLSEWGSDGIKQWGKSKRQRVNRLTTAEIPEYVRWDQADQYTLPDGTSTAKVVNLGLRLSNLCNQKCIMCSPEYSSLWYEDWNKLWGNVQVMPPGTVWGDKEYRLTTDSKGREILDYSKWWDSEIWWERFDKIAPDLRHIYFSGGEPLVAPAMTKILDKLIENDFAKNIILRYDTNLTVINNKIIEKFKHFKKINFCVSVDDIEERYELIRFPGKYNTIIDNIKTLKDNGMDIHYLSCCIGIGSIYAIERLSAVAEELNIPVEFRFLEGPNWLDLRSLPKSAKEEIINHYQSLMHHSEKRTTWYKAIIKFLEKYIDEDKEWKYREFVIVMDKLDKIRGTNWRQVLPEIQDILARHCPDIGA